MKNEDIKVGDIVPAKIRLELYQELHTIIKESSGNYYMLPEPMICLMLPCLLWDLNEYRDDGPDNKSWCQHSTLEMFPELIKEYIEMIEYYDKASDKPKRFKMRLFVLEVMINSVIKKIENA